MGRPKKIHYSVNQPVVFVWSRNKKYGTIQSRSLKGKKMYYDVLGDDGKVYEELYTDDSEIACILTRETDIVLKALEKRKAREKEGISDDPITRPKVDVVDDFEPIDEEDDQPF